MKKYILTSVFVLSIALFGASSNVANAQSAPSVTLSASPTSVAYNGTTTVSYTVTGATSCTGSSGSIGWAGSKSIYSGGFYSTPLTSTVQYILQCSNSYGTITKAVTVSVAPQSGGGGGSGGGGSGYAPTVSITASPTTINSGGSSTVSWSVTGATSCTSTGGTFGWSGSKSIYGGNFYISSITNTTTYNISCTNNSGTTNQSVTIYVNTIPPQQTYIPVVTVYASPTSINQGGSSVLSWSATNNPTSCIINGWVGNMGAPNGSKTVYPTSTTTYTVTCTNSAGSGYGSTTINVISTPPPTNPPVVTVYASPTSINQGGSSNISWSATGNPTSCSGSWTGNIASYGNQNVFPNSTTTYTVTCSNNGGTASGYAVVSVNNVPPPTNPPVVTVYASPTSINQGGSSNISWSATGNPTSCSGSWTGNIASYGNQNVFPNSTTTYTVTCSNNGGTASGYAVVSVNNVPPPTPNPTVNITANPSFVQYNGATTISWNSNNANTCSGTNGANGWFGIKNPNSTFYTGALMYTTTFTIICTNNAGIQAIDSVTVTVDQQNSIPSVTTNAPTSVSTNRATLNGYVNTNSGSYATAWFEWGFNGNLYNQTPHVNFGTTNANIDYILGGLAPNTTYYYRAVAMGSNGQRIEGSQVSFTTQSDYTGCTYNCYNNQQPYVTTYSASNINESSATLNGYVETNGNYTARWFEYGTTSNSLYNSTNHNSQYNGGNFSQYISGLNTNTTYYYRAVAQGSSGLIYGNVLSFNTFNNYNYNNGTCSTNNTLCAPTAVTTLATNVGGTSARLNGLGIIQNNVNTTGYFEWGTTAALTGGTTTSGYIGSSSSSPFYSSLFGLSNNTTYYYRAVVSNQYGISKGDIMSFRTNVVTNTNTNTNTVTRVIYRNVVTNTNTTDLQANGIARPSLVFLTVNQNNAGFDVIRKGTEAGYVITWKNVSGRLLRDVVLRVSIPKELQFVETSRGYFSNENSTVVLNIGNLNPQEEGSLFIRTNVTTDAELGKIVVVTGNLAYTTVDDNTQEEVFAYDKSTVENAGTNINLQGNALFGYGFWPSTLLGWLILLLIILLIILVARMAYNRSRSTIVTDTHGNTTVHHS